MELCCPLVASVAAYSHVRAQLLSPVGLCDLMVAPKPHCLRDSPGKNTGVSCRLLLQDPVTSFRLQGHPCAGGDWGSYNTLVGSDFPTRRSSGGSGLCGEAR